MSNLSVLNETMVTLEPYPDQYGYWAVFGAILRESFEMPVPGEAPLIAGSFIAFQGDISIFSVLVVAWVAVSEREIKSFQDETTWPMHFFVILFIPRTLPKYLGGANNIRESVEKNRGDHD
jgi:hypothetical protein